MQMIYVIKFLIAPHLNFVGTPSSENVPTIIKSARCLMHGEDVIYTRRTRFNCS